MGMKSLAIFLLILLLWCVGLAAFGERVGNSTPAPEPPQADGIVALTGASTMRIEAATRLLELGRGQRLLISGVNEEVRPQELRDVTKGAGRAFDCCVDMGFDAKDTQGNARETASWARHHGFESLIVVTADYHIPRSLLELQAVMPEVTLHPYPVATGTVNAQRWWATAGDARQMIVEYSKYLVILSREAMRSIGGGQSAPADASAPA